jgi:hypothetical protein
LSANRDFLFNIFPSTVLAEVEGRGRWWNWSQIWLQGMRKATLNLRVTLEFQTQAFARSVRQNTW